MNSTRVRLLLASLSIVLAAPTTQATNFDVTQSGFGFVPANITIQVGDTITWHRTTLSHTVTEGTDGIVDGDEPFNGFINVSTPTFSFTFDSAFVAANPRPGNKYDYFCEPHFPAMKGTITVNPEPGTAYCFGDGIDTVVTTGCPCGNFGNAGRGCANSNSELGGAKLTAAGTTSPNTLVFTCDGIPNNNLCTFLRGTLNDATGTVFGDGVKCASGTVLRFGQQTSGQGGNDPNTVASGAASVTAGNTRYYQVHYRNPNAGFCPPELFNVSSGYRIVW